MTNTPRRALLGALVAAPVLGAAAAAPAAPTAVDLSALDETGLWEAGIRCADAGFASVCRAALAANAHALAVDRLYSDASDSADAATPAFPECLTLPCVLRDLHSGQPKREWTAHWHAKQERSQPPLEVYARRFAKAQGITYGRDVEADLRARFEAWDAQRRDARSRFDVDDLAASSDRAWQTASDARWKVFRYPARTFDVVALKVQLRVRYESDLDEDEGEPMRSVVADITRVLALHA